MAVGARQAFPEPALDLCPIADGGEGTSEVFTRAFACIPQPCLAMDPLGNNRTVHWLQLSTAGSRPATALIEIASVSGLLLVPQAQRDPLHTTAYGVGMMIRSALDAGMNRILLALGGSATNEAGLSVAQALGARLFDQSGRIIESPLEGRHLCDLGAVDLGSIDPRIRRTEFRVLVDVDCPLHGPQGAARRFAAQKFAPGTSDVTSKVDVLERGLIQAARLFPQCDPWTPGAGAAGGMGFGLMAALDATLVSGAKEILDILRIHERIAAADLVLTGEGRLDVSSSHGKACWTLGQACNQAGKPVLAICGQVDHSGLLDEMLTIPFDQTAMLDGPESAGLGAPETLARATAVALTEWKSSRDQS